MRALVIITLISSASLGIFAETNLNGPIVFKDNLILAHDLKNGLHLIDRAKNSIKPMGNATGSMDRWFRLTKDKLYAVFVSPNRGKPWAPYQIELKTQSIQTIPTPFENYWTLGVDSLSDDYVVQSSMDPVSKQRLLYVTNTKTKNHEAIGEGTWPTSSPDGNRIVYMSKDMADDTKLHEIYMYDRETKTTERITQNDHYDAFPIITDDNKIHFITQDGENYYLATYDYSTKQTVRYEQPVMNDSRPAISDDNESLIFSIQSADSENLELFSLHMASGQVSKLIN